MAIGSVAGLQVVARQRGQGTPTCGSCPESVVSPLASSPAYAPDRWLGRTMGGGPDGNPLGDLRDLLGNLGGTAPAPSTRFPPATNYPAYPPTSAYQPVPQQPVVTAPPIQPIAPSGPYSPPAYAPRPATPAAPAVPVVPALPVVPVVPVVPAEIQAVVDATNRERARYGLRPLTASPALNRVAQNRSADMARRNYFDHTDPDGRDPFWHLRNAGVRYMAGAENIAMGQRGAAEVVAGWMNSPGHRANILNGRLGQIGVGLARDSRGTPYWTQIFTD